MRIVVALGGNALGNNPKEQLELVEIASKSIVDLVEEGNEVIISHGNGPQVGMIIKAFETSNKIDESSPKIPFAECTAMSQGYIGFHLQNKIKEELSLRNIKKDVLSVVTQVLVDEKDGGFKNPTKPIGSFYTKEEIEKISDETNIDYIEDSGRGYRRVVASPKPIDIVESSSINSLVNSGYIVIASGGGGIPVIKKENSLIGVDAVIDKDFATAKLAEKLNADYLVILTAVDKVFINFGKENQLSLDSLSIEDMDKYIDSGEFGKGSMEPKVKACKEFVLSGNNKKALITSLTRVKDAFNGKTGTVIEK